MRKRRFLQATAAAVAGVVLTGCGGGGGSDDGVPIGSDTLLQLLQQDSRFATFLAAADKAGLTGTLDAAGSSLTLFAAENDAFDSLAGRLALGDGATLVATLSGAQWSSILRFALLPTRRSLSSLTGRTDTLYEYRTDPQQLIFVSGSGPFNIWDGVGRTSITLLRDDIAASNGVLHVTSDVLLPRGVLTVSQMLLASFDSFSDFAGSMVASGNSGALDGPGPFTVFAPGNNAAAAGLGSDRVRHHVMTGELDGDDFAAQQTLTPLFGRQVLLRDGTGAVVLATLSHSTGGVIANVTDVDFFASNGVIHVIDAVMSL